MCVCVCFNNNNDFGLVGVMGANCEYFVSIEITIQEFLFYMIGIGGDKRPRLDTHLLDHAPTTYQGKGDPVQT